MTGGSDRPDVSALVETLGIRRKAAIGFGTGLLVAGMVYGYRLGELAGPVRDTRGSPVLFLGLAVVLAVTLGFFVTGLLVVARAVRLSRE